MTREFNPKFTRDQGKMERTNNIALLQKKKSCFFFNYFPKNKSLTNKHRPRDEFLST